MKDKAPAGFFTKLKDGGFGVVEFDVTGDTRTVLKVGVQLALQEHSSFTHYCVKENANGSNELHFLWSGGGDKDALPLPFTLKDPDAIVMFIGSWIQENGLFDHSTYVGGDGSDTYGFRLTNDQQDREWPVRSNYLALRVCPRFVYYGK